MKNKINNIAIIGLGLIGGSIAKALKEKGYKIIGIDKNSKTINLALKEKAINKGFTSLIPKALESTDIIFICTPLNLITTYINKHCKLKLKNNVIITDVGSTKSDICNYANKFPPNFEFPISNLQMFIGGHPMTGSEKDGFQSSTGNLFKNSLWFLTPTEKSKRMVLAFDLLAKVIKNTGAKIKIISDKEHDEIAALISHFPLLISICLCQNIINLKNKIVKTMASLAASSGFRDTTRIASCNPVLIDELLKTNSSELKKETARFIKTLNNLNKNITSKKSLYKLFKETSNWRKNLYNSKGQNKKLMVNRTV